ncbi:MAG: alkaline phosphatase family protein [Candidatus Binatia bacterium]
MGKARVLVIGLDAAEPALLDRWCRSGDLPALRRLLDRSASGRLETGTRQFPDAATYSAYTGLRAARLGRYNFIQPSRTAPRLELIGAALPNGEPFWVTAGRHGRRCIVVDTPKIGLYPPAGGVHVVGWGTHGFSGALQAHPPEVATEILARHGSYPRPNCDNHGRTRRSYGRLRRGLLDGIAARRDLLLDLMRRRDWDLFFAVFSETHCAGHNLWHVDAAADGRPPIQPDGEPSRAVREIYAAVDAAIGTLLDAAGPDTRVVLVSTQGMRPQYHGRDLVPALLRLWGMHEARNRAPDPGREPRCRVRRPWLQTVREAVPLPWQYVVRRHLPRGLSEALLCRFMGVMELDVAARAYQAPNNEITPALRINVVGRDPAGRVRPGQEYEELRDFLAARLRALVNPATGRPALADVSLTDDVHPGEHRDVLPDVTGYWSAEAPIEALYSPGYGTVVGAHRDYRSGGHGPDGLLAVSGAPGRFVGAHIVDLAPTVLDLLGVPIPPGLDGRSLAPV